MGGINLEADVPCRIVPEPTGGGLFRHLSLSWRSLSSAKVVWVREKFFIWFELVLTCSCCIFSGTESASRNLLSESLHCRRRLIAKNLGGFLLLFKRLPPEGWSTGAGKRPNGRSCRDETWIVYQGFNDCRLCTTQWKTTKIETEIFRKNCLEVFLTISCSITLRGRNVTQASSRIVFKRRICESGKTKEWPSPVWYI